MGDSRVGGVRDRERMRDRETGTERDSRRMMGSKADLTLRGRGRGA